MISKKFALMLTAIALVTAIGVATVGTALAQTTTPPTQTTPGAAAPSTGSTTTTPKQDFGFGFGFRGGDAAASFDLVAQKLGMTPTELFEALHSGKTLSQIAQEKGVDLATIQSTLNANRITEMKAQLAQAVKDGTMTQEEADWWTTGIDKGWVGAGKGGPGFGMMGGGRGHGHGGDFGMFGGRSNESQNQNQTAPSTGTTS